MTVLTVWRTTRSLGAPTLTRQNWAGANNNIETKVESDNYAATCSYKWEAGPGVIRIIGGVFYQK